MSGKEKMRNRNRIDHLMISFEHAQKLVEFADSKANILLVVHSLVLTISTAVFSIIYTNIEIPLNGLLIFSIVLIIIFVLAVVGSLYFAIIVIYPRDPDDDESIFYYVTISKSGKDQYLDKINNLTEDELAESLAHQSYNISKIAQKKMKHVRYSSIFSGIYLLFLILSTSLSIIGSVI